MMHKKKKLKEKALNTAISFIAIPINLVLSGNVEKVNGIKIFFHIYASLGNLYVQMQNR